MASPWAAYGAVLQRVFNGEELPGILANLPPWPHERVATLFIINDDETIKKAVKEAIAATTTDHGWTGPKPLGYSEYLSKHLDMHLPYEQYGLYGSTAAGIGYCAQQVWRSRLLMRAAHEPNATQARELMLEANAKEVDVGRAVYLAKKFRARGLLAVVGAPIMWLGLMTLSAAYKRKLSQVVDIGCET